MCIYIYTLTCIYRHIYIYSREQTCLRLPFQVSTNMSTLYRRFPGECIATFFLHIDPKTANMSQLLQLGPLDFDHDLGYVSYFGGIDSANNHSHMSKPHPLNNTDTLGGRFPWLVIQSLLNAAGFWNAPPPQSSCPPTSIIYDALFRKELGPFFSPPFCYQCSL